ncbi:Protrudin [Trichoplax sp. H2]|nr:Protrudin [Trichoplax sp. H2]|eukprot:RDD42707.1 Protrudin [Trichoplax sp. H2]
MAPVEQIERKIELAVLVDNYKKVKRFLRPLRYFYQWLDDLLNWKSGLRSLIALLLLTTITLDAFILTLLLSLLCLLVVSRWIYLPKDVIVEDLKSNLPEPEMQDHDFVIVSEQAANEKLSKTAIKEYKQMLAEMDDLLNKIRIARDHFISIVKWNRPKATMTITIIVLLATLAYPVMPIRGYWIGFVTTAFLFQPYISNASKSPENSETQQASNEEQNDDNLAAAGDTAAINSENQVDSDDEVDFESDDDEEAIPMSKNDLRSITHRKSVMTRFNELKRRRRHIKSGHCASCDSSFSKMLIRRQYCRACGDSFCSRCCSMKVPRAVFGATAPAAYVETVLVCNSCYADLKDTLLQVQAAANRQNITDASAFSHSSNVNT